MDIQWFSVVLYQRETSMIPWHTWKCPNKDIEHKSFFCRILIIIYFSIHAYWSPEFCCLMLAGQKAVNPVWWPEVLVKFTFQHQMMETSIESIGFILVYKKQPQAYPLKTLLPTTRVTASKANTPCIIYRAEIWDNTGYLIHQKFPWFCPAIIHSMTLSSHFSFYI
jgi:hypothetical protein